MRLTLDSNILIYAFAEDAVRTPIARKIMESVIGADLILTTQALGEFVRVTRHKYPASLPDALTAVTGWSLIFAVAATLPEHLVDAAHLADRHQLQFWDSLIVSVAAGAGAEVMLTEDMHDGAVFAGVRLMNPFLATNAATIAALLTPAPGTA